MLPTNQLIRDFISKQQERGISEVSVEDIRAYEIDYLITNLSEETDEIVLSTQREFDATVKRFLLEASLRANLIEPMPAPEDVADRQPPAKAQSFLSLLLEAKDREVVIGDLIERYGIKIEQRGKLRADLWFYQQVMWSVWPLLRRALVKLRRLGVAR